MGDVVHLPILQETRDQRRSRRPREVRKRTESIVRMSKTELRFGTMVADAQLEELGGVVRPSTRGACIDDERPCPWVSCVHHLYLDVSDAGSIKLNFPDREPDELPVSCALDIAASGPQRLDTVGLFMNVVRERVRQVEEIALRRFKVRALLFFGKDFL